MHTSSRDRDAPRRGRDGRGVRRPTILLPLLAAVTLLAACTFKGPTMTIDYKSPENREIWGLY